ncbi:hypothetical protein AB4Z54_65855, partial [Streptomyces sp. MCAF7]
PHAQGTAFSGPLDEHRLRRALNRGSYPVTRSDSPVLAESPVLVGGPLPTRHLGHIAVHGAAHPAGHGAGHGPRRAESHTHPPSRSNTETPVPPT